MATEAKSSLNLVEISSDSEEEREKAIKSEKKSGNKGQSKRKCGAKGLGKGNSKKKARRYSDVEIWTADEKELMDDDCCILASDPAGEVDLSRPISDSEQDFSVLAVRGKVACKDYPHARHSCAEYPFSQTSHEDCCSQCYCYVCDVSAPCSYWKGSNGHCHAFSRDKKWNVKRQASRLTKILALSSCPTKTSQ